MQRVEFTLACGDGHFVSAQFRLCLLQAGLQSGLLALESALALAELSDHFVKFAESRLEFGNLVFATENGGRPFAVAVGVTAGENSVPVQQLPFQGDEIASAFAFAPGVGRRGEVRHNQRVAQQTVQQ